MCGAISRHRQQEGSIGMTRTISRGTALILSLATLLFLGFGAAGTATAKPRTADPTTAPVTGTLANGTGSVTGTFDVTRFAVQNGTLMAVGTLNGTVADAAGTTLASGPQQVALPVNTAASTGSCQILDLVLGPLDLNLLGLVVHLDQVHLNITAQQGPGNLLGNLLCAVANLLNANTGVSAILNQIAALLNQLLGVLG
jgi:hypothetical protein